jgi:hypothetical protein
VTNSNYLHPPKSALDLTLNWVNEQRQECGLDPLDQMPTGDCLGGSCPIFHALKHTGVNWVAHAWLTKSVLGPDNDLSEIEPIPLPDFAQDFIDYHAENRFWLYGAQA